MAVFFDFDSTVVSKETLDETIERALLMHPERERIVHEIEEVTRLGMEGKLDFKESVRRRLGVVPISRKHLEEVGVAMRDELTPGIADVFKWLEEKNCPTYIVSGGFEECILPVSEHLHIPHGNVLTNRFLFSPEGLVSDVDESSLLWTNHGKTPALRAMRERHLNEPFIMIGDGMNDCRAYESGAADHFIGFGANVVRQVVKEKAPHFAHTVHELFEILKKRIH